MKNTILGLVAASLLATPALATSWKTELFARVDADADGQVALAELEKTGCRVNKKFFAYADEDRNGLLSKSEFFEHRDLFSKCK
jgi:Ca2+-binding EF-hand superfamily protein